MDIPHGSAQFVSKVDSPDLHKFCACFACSDKIKGKNEPILTDYYCVMSGNVFFFRILVSSRCYDNPLTDSSHRETQNCTLNSLHLNGFAKCLCHCLKLEAWEWILPSAEKGLTSFFFLETLRAQRRISSIFLGEKVAKGFIKISSRDLNHSFDPITF